MSTVLIAFGAVFVGISIFLVVKISILLKNGLQTKGKILGFESKSYRNALFPTVEFTTVDGELIVETAEISAFQFLLKKGQVVTIVYSSKSPKRFFIKEESTYFVVAFFFIFGLVFFGFGISKLLGN